MLFYNKRKLIKSRI